MRQLAQPFRLTTPHPEGVPIKSEFRTEISKRIALAFCHPIEERSGEETSLGVSAFLCLTQNFQASITEEKKGSRGLRSVER